jgi:hypothetical protein
MKVWIADKITVMENFYKFENSSSIEVSSVATRCNTDNVEVSKVRV